jgi:hypothetical protein
VGLLLAVAFWSWLQARDPAQSMIERGLDPATVARAPALAELYAYRLMDALPPHAILLAQGDSEVFAAWYAQGAACARLDVLPVGVSFLKEEWYAAMMNAHPARLQGLVTGGGTPQTAREFVDRLLRVAITPAFSAGRPTFLLTADTTVVELLGRAVQVFPVATLLSPDEQAVVGVVYPVTVVAPTLFRLSPR